jgi:hypothetical protein
MPTITRDGKEHPDGVKTGRASLATPEVIESWKDAYRAFAEAPVTTYPDHQYRSRGEKQRHERTQRMNFVMRVLGLTRKQAKRRVKNYEQAKRLRRV